MGPKIISLGCFLCFLGLFLSTNDRLGGFGLLALIVGAVITLIERIKGSKEDKKTNATTTSTATTTTTTSAPESEEGLEQAVKEGKPLVPQETGGKMRKKIFSKNFGIHL